MKRKPKIYIDNPVILDLKEAGIEPIAEDEIFVALPFNGKYSCSNYGRVYSAHRKRLLKPQRYGNARVGLRPSYKLLTNPGKYKNYFAHVLVAQLFCKRPTSRRKLEVHHIDKDAQNAYYRNLMYVEKDAHSLIDQDKKLYLYNLENGTFKNFKSYTRLSNYTGANVRALYNAVNSNEPSFTYFNGWQGWEIPHVEYNGLPLHIGLDCG